jgi:ADP-ribosyl-[dinitrogen reductase] hydrolase
MDRYCRWAETGYLSSTGSCFDIGRTVASALRRFREDGQPFAGSEDQQTAGNGSIMRLAPIPMFFFPDVDAVESNAGTSSRTTHGAAECVDACRLLGRIICRALLGLSKDEVAYGDRETFSGALKIVEIARGSYAGKGEDAVRGSGYVVESLEAAMWCFMNTDSFEAAVLRATNLGDDADTTAAVCGQVAGAFYGFSGIPTRWLESLSLRSEIMELADRMYAIDEPRPIRRTKSLETKSRQE